MTEEEKAKSDEEGRMLVGMTGERQVEKGNKKQED